MKKLLFVLLALGSFSAFASDEACYQVSADGRAWSRTPEILCVTTLDARSNQVELTLKSGLPFSQQTVATFHFSLLSAARCMDCNQNVYGLANPSNSTFNALAIRFNGKRDLQTGKEAGEVQIGSTKLFYKNDR